MDDEGGTTTDLVTITAVSGEGKERSFVIDELVEFVAIL
jgi:hypothetical protein